jgi:hypothetical protein
MMLMGHIAIWAAAAGRTFGLDGVLRAGWIHNDTSPFVLLRRAS